MSKNIFERRGEGGASAVAIVAILVIVIIGVYFIFFRGNTSSGPSDVQVNLPDTVNVNTPDMPGDTSQPGSR